MKKLLLAGVVATVAAFGFGSIPVRAQEPTIPIIVKDTTSFYWQIVLAGARKAGQDLHVKVPELGPQSESDISGQISILETRSPGSRPRSSSHRRSSQPSASRSTPPPSRSRSSASTAAPTARPSPRS